MNNAMTLFNSPQGFLVSIGPFAVLSVGAAILEFQNVSPSTELDAERLVNGSPMFSPHGAPTGTPKTLFGTLVVG